MRHRAIAVRGLAAPSVVNGCSHDAIGYSMASTTRLQYMACMARLLNDRMAVGIHLIGHDDVQTTRQPDLLVLAWHAQACGMMTGLTLNAA